MRHSRDEVKKDKLYYLGEDNLSRETTILLNFKGVTTDS